MRKFSFSNRIIPIWNSLPDYVVASRTINTFKARLDKLWENQNVRYTWKADISFTDTCVKILSHRQHVLISRHSVCAIKEHLHIHSSMAKALS